MRNFESVSVERVANIYFDGKVTSRTVILPSGEKKTLGIMMPGEYRFDTADKELMEIQAGEVEVKLAGESEWCAYTAGSSFEVEANSTFDIRVKTISDYCCSYLG
jgi:uncharacterized protein YaiE (UPF0345 family)